MAAVPVKEYSHTVICSYANPEMVESEFSNFVLNVKHQYPTFEVFIFL